jgi:hypothetical protein
MTLNFPNASRSYEARRNQVLFWGYDRTREVSFLVDGAAIAKLDSSAKPGEDSMLGAFDRALDRIHAVARLAYARRQPQQAYLLASEDF